MHGAAVDIGPDMIAEASKAFGSADVFLEKCLVNPRPRCRSWLDHHGYDIPPFYDSMLAKVIVGAMTWADAIKRGERALRDMGLFGIKTTIPYYLKILQHPDFQAGCFNTGFVEKYPDLINYSNKPRPEILAGVIAVALAAHTGL